MDNLAVPYKEICGNQEEQRELLEKYAATALNSILSHQQKESISKIVATAVSEYSNSNLKESSLLERITMKKVIALIDSQLVHRTT